MVTTATASTSWVPTTHSNVLTLATVGQRVSDVDGGPLGRDPGVLPSTAVVSPAAIADPALAAIQQSSPFGKWGTQPTPAPVVLTFSFYDGTVPLTQGGTDPAPLDAAHRDALRQALAAFSDVAGVTFEEVAESTTGSPTTGIWGATGALVGHIRFIDDRALDGGSFTAAYTEEPSALIASSGLVAFDVDRFGIPDDVTRGGQWYGLAVHELGHALGLTHSFDGEDPKPAVGDPRAAFGNWHSGWTIMAYTAPGPDQLPSGQRHDAIGPMVADVAVLQSEYGANRTTRTGNDVYKLSGAYPDDAVWDADGIDTIDASAANVTLLGEQGPTDVLRRPGDPVPAIGWFTKWTGVAIDLRPGQVGTHLAVAYGVALENAIGSRGHDLIIGTDPGTLYAGDGTATTTDGANRLDGGAGDDTIMGMGGDDTLIGGPGSNLLDGGEGTDTVLFGVASTAATVVRDGGDLVVTTAGAVDRIRGVEILSFTDRAVAATDAMAVLSPTPVAPPVVVPPVVTPPPVNSQPATAPSTAPDPAPTTTPTAVIDPHRRLEVWADGVAREMTMDHYSGPVAWLQNMHVGTDSSEAMRGTDFADFINTVGGDDAIEGGAGDDVLDGGTGSNFLIGGSGNDTFFVDGRNAGVTWSTVTDLEKGEWVTAWGWRPGTSKLTWEEMAGAEGYKGATARIDLDGNGSIDMSMTITGKSSGAVLALPGQVNGSNYLAFTLN